MSLPYRTVKFVSHIGDIKMNDKTTLTSALNVPSFKYNFLSVKKLTEPALLRVIFYPLCCLLQDLQTNWVIVVGKMVGRLYLLDGSCFKKEEFDYYTKYLKYSMILCKNLK